MAIKAFESSLASESSGVIRFILILLLFVGLCTSAPAATEIAETPVHAPAPEWMPTALPAHRKHTLPDMSTRAPGDLSVTIGPVLSGSLIKVGSLDPIRFDAVYSEPISLKSALTYAVANNLSIKVSRESWIYQRYQLLSNMGSFLPSNSITWNIVRSYVEPNKTISNSRVFTETVKFPVFQGGSVSYNALAQYYREAGWKKAYKTTLQDTLLAVYQNYTSAQLNRAQLRIRAMAVEVSEAQLRQNEKSYLAGKGTRYAIMQSKAQLESDRNDLLDQQSALRGSAINLAFVLNCPMSVNLMPVEDTVSLATMLDLTRATPESLVDIAVHNRPDLRQYELFRLAAERTVQATAAPLYPSMTLFPSYTRSSTTVSASEPSSSSSSSSSDSSSNVAGAGVFGGLFNTVQRGMVSGLTTSGMGVTAAMNVCAANALSRQALWQANQQLLTADKQIRVDYLNIMTAQAKIEAAAAELAAAQEALRLAQARAKAGVATNLDVIQSQRDFVSAAIKRVKAIVDANNAQAQLLHDLGIISVDALTNPLKDRRQ